MLRRLRARRDAAVCGFLAAHPDSTGLQLAAGLGVGTGSVYPRLARLRAAGLVEARWRSGPCPQPRLYRLTTDGQES